MSFKYCPSRGHWMAGMKLVLEFNTREEFIKHLQTELGLYGFEVKPEDVKITEGVYCPLKKWHVWDVEVVGLDIIGSLDGPPPDFKMIRYRPHRGSLAAAMEEQQEFSTADKLLDFLQSEYYDWVRKPLHAKDIKVEKYCYDKRIGWDTHILSVEGYGVIGWIDCMVEFVE